jgi:ABC-type polysaccharide/polyol phosphate transport system ATPase subunit
MTTSKNKVLEVSGLSKLYSRNQALTRRRLADTFKRTLLGRVPAPAKLKQGEFWSLKDVNFSIERGEALGVIGFNGAGKTTLLRLLSGQMLPDEGEIQLFGKSAAMIDLTAGFQMSANGKQNIFLRNAMLGRSHDQIVASYDEIIDFAELGDAIDAPLSTYSSGMLMRLAFSIMVAMKPDVLFIDEILSVGDFHFRQKCLAKIRELRDSAGVVFVSHSMRDISRFCDRVMVLDHGSPIFIGEPDKAIEVYSSLAPRPQGERSPDLEKHLFSYKNDQLIGEVTHHWCDAQGHPISTLRSGDPVYLHCTFQLLYKPDNPVVGVPIHNESGELISGVSTENTSQPLPITTGKCCEIILSIDSFNLTPGTYYSVTTVVDGPQHLYRGKNSSLEVLSRDKPYWGKVVLPHKHVVLEA